MRLPKDSKATLNNVKPNDIKRSTAFLFHFSAHHQFWPLESQYTFKHKKHGF